MHCSVLDEYMSQIHHVNCKVPTHPQDYKLDKNFPGYFIKGVI